MEKLSVKIQQHQQVTKLSKVIHRVQVAVSARTGCIFFRLAMIKKALLMKSMVRYEY